MPSTASASQDQILLILSDVHYASEAEKARGRHHDHQIRHPVARVLAKSFDYLWQRDVFAHNHWLDLFLRQAGDPDWVVAVGDYSAGASLYGISDDASLASARQCLGLLRARFGKRFLAVTGDHELGKVSLFGGSGGLRLASWERLESELAMQPFWMRDLGCYRLMAVVSSLVALPAFEADALAAELPAWRGLREEHLTAIRHGFDTLESGQQVILFCHDPTALPFLWREPAIRNRLPRVAQTVIGHLHTPLVLWKSRLLAGMPAIGFLGHAMRRVSTALHEARIWKPFRVRLCPALAGIEVWRNSGFFEVGLDPSGVRPPRFQWRRLSRDPARGEKQRR
jgi:hypothetical protein